MEVTINYNGQAVAVEVTLEVYEFLDRANHKTENLFHEQRRHWDGREFDEYIITTEGVGAYGETPEEYLCHMETLHELMAVLDTCTEAQRRRFLLYALDGLFPAAEQCGQKYALYHVTKQQNILYYARMALCRPGAFLSLWSRNIGSAWPELYPRCRSPPPHSDLPKKSEWRKGRWKLPSIITDKL